MVPHLSYQGWVAGEWPAWDPLGKSLCSTWQQSAEWRRSHLTLWFFDRCVHWLLRAIFSFPYWWGGMEWGMTPVDSTPALISQRSLKAIGLPQLTGKKICRFNSGSETLEEQQNWLSSEASGEPRSRTATVPGGAQDINEPPQEKRGLLYSTWFVPLSSRMWHKVVSE